MNSIAIKHRVAFDDFSLDIDTHIPDSGITGVFGESGSGKTTLLRCIAGLERSAGDDAEAVHRRRIGYVFQEPQLFAHLTVRRNIEFGMRRNPSSGVSVEDVATMLEIGGLLDRSVSGLSGGEAQRVSIARVLCQSPKLVLMDEPLSAMDERRKNDVLPYLDRLHAESAVPIIYVSHNIDEICRLSDHLLILDNGQLVAEGELQQVLARTDLTQLHGRNAGAVIDATQGDYDSEFDLTAFDFSGGRLWAAGAFDARRVRLRVSANDISLSRVEASSSTILNILPCTIAAIDAESPSANLVKLQIGREFLIARITRRSTHALNLQRGDEVFAQIKSVTVRR